MSGRARDDFERLRDARARRREAPPTFPQGGRAAFTARVMDPPVVHAGTFMKVAPLGVSAFDEAVGKAPVLTPDTLEAHARYVLNLGPHRFLAGEDLVADGVDYRWVAQEPYECAVADLPLGDLQATLTYCSDVSGPVIASTIVGLTRYANTDNYMALAGVDNAPSARGGVVWRGPCLRFRSLNNTSLSGQKQTCTPYIFDFNTYLDFLPEFFCGGSAFYLVIHRRISQADPAVPCVEPPQRCDPYAKGDTTWDVLATYGGLFSGATWSTSSGAFFGVDPAATSSDPFHMRFVRGGSYSACDSFNEVVIVDAP